MNPISRRSWPTQILARVRILFWVKGIGTSLFIALFFRGYFAVLQHPLAPPATMPLTPVDAWIPLVPAAFAAYVSLWFYVSLAPALLTGIPALLRFGRWMAAMCLFCLGIFWLLPTAVPPLPFDWSQHPEMALIRGVDPGGNACPSLHVASAVFAGIWLDRLFRAIGVPALLRWISAGQCLLILWSTLAIRQHVFLDVLAGLAVGVVFAWLSLRNVRRVAATGEI